MRRALLILLILPVLPLFLSFREFIGPDCKISERTVGSDDFQVNVLTYHSGENAAQRTVLIMPPTGGKTFLEESYARAFCAAGIDAHILTKWTDWDELSFDLKIHQRFYARALRAIEIVLGDVKVPYVGIFGTSVGAMQASIAVSRFPKIQAAFLVVGGTPIANVTADSDQEILVEARLARFKEFKFRSMDEYVGAIDQFLILNGEKMRVQDRGKKIGIVLGTQDTVVPAVHQKKMREILKPVYVREYSHNHLITILRTWLELRGEVVEFFRG